MDCLDMKKQVERAVKIETPDIALNFFINRQCDRVVTMP